METRYNLKSPGEQGGAVGSAGRGDRSDPGLRGRHCGPLASAATRGSTPGVALYARPPPAAPVQAAGQGGRRAPAAQPGDWSAPPAPGLSLPSLLSRGAGL